MHQGELARSPSMAQAEMIQRLNPVTVSRPRPPKLTPSSASISLHDAEFEVGQEGKGVQREGIRKRDSRIRETNDDDDDETLKTCEDRVVDPKLVKAAAATGTTQILETLRAREGFKCDFERVKEHHGPFGSCFPGSQY